MSYWDVFRSLLDQIAHEDDLLVSRTWLLASQFLLLLVYFSIDSNKTGPRPVNYHRLIGAIGMLSTIFIYSSILASEFEFVALRTRLLRLAADHSDLPMRQLPSIGIGSGLLCPILLALLVLYAWVLLTIGSRLTAALTVISGIFFAVFFVGRAHELPDGSAATVLIGASLALAFTVLGAAALVAVLARRVRV